MKAVEHLTKKRVTEKKRSPINISQGFGEPSGGTNTSPVAVQQYLPSEDPFTFVFKDHRCNQAFKEIQAHPGGGLDRFNVHDRSCGIIQSLSSASEMEKNPFVQAGAIDGGMDQLKDSCPSIPLCQILKATNDFDDALVIGVGGFGKVYKANIGGGATTTVVAIKRLRAKSKQGADEFWKEVKLRSKLRHTSLVSLIGYCNENQEMILVYEHIARATLANHLYKTSRCHLTWEQRLNICLHAARGLDYLHNGTLQGIIHGDVKSTNILLDEHLVAKVSDLGLSKSTTTHTTTHVNIVAKGTFGYLDPDYFFTRRLTKKSDVYAFGVVLLEVLCGRPAIDLSVLDEERILSHWAQMNIKEGTLDRIIDPSLNGDTTPDSLEYFAELANKCLHNQPKERPTMTEVVKSLQIALVSHERQGRSQGTIAKAWTLGGLLSRHRNPLLVPPNEIQKSSIPANGVGKPAKRTTTAFLATNSKAFDDFKARSKETFMIHQENIVKKEEGFINEHLPDHVFECQVQAGSEIESTSMYDRSGITQSLSSASEMENLTKSALSLDDSTKPRSLPDFDATENKAVKVYTSWGRGCWHSMEELEQGTTLEELGMDPENEGIISDLLRFVSDKEEFYKKAGKDWKMGYLLYDSPGTDRSSLIAAMANFLEFDIYHLDLTGLTSISELTNVLVSIRNRSLIAIQDFDQWAGKLPDFKTELTLSGLLKIIHGLLSSCGDERIIVLTTNNNRIGSVDAALLRSLNIDSYIHTSSPRPKALPDGGEIVLLDPSEQKPSVDFDATNNRAYQSDDLVSNSEEKNTREASRRQCMPESVPSLVDSMTRISLTDFDAPDNSAHLVMAYQSGPIVFNLEKKDMGEVLSRECLTKSVLSLDDSSKQKSLSDVAVTGKKSHIVRAHESGPVVSFSDDKNGEEALKRECITKSILGLEDLQQHSDGRGDAAAKSFCAIYDLGIHTADSLARISFEVLKTLPTREQPNDCVSLLSLGRLALEDCVQQEKSPDLPRVTQINGVERRVTKLPRYFGGLTAQFSSSSRWPIGLPDGGYIVLLDPLDQSTKHIEYVARADQCSPTLSLAEKKMVRKTLKRKCRTMSVIFEDNHQYFARRCEGTDKSLGATRIFRKHGINQVSTVKRIKQRGIHQWPFFRQKWATRKGFSLGEGRPFEVSRLSMDEKLDSRLQLIHTSQFARSSPQALSLPDGGEIVRPTALSSSEFAATNNRAHLVGQDQNSSTASHYECKNTRETSDKQGLEDLEQHLGCKHKHAVKSLGVSGSMFKGTCRQHWVYWWPVRLKNNAKRICRQLAIDHETTAKRIRWQLGTHRWPFKQSAISLPDGGHILSLSEKKIGRKTLKRKCRSMSVLSLEDHKQHVDRRWEGAAKSHGTKRICRQLVIHRLSTAKRIRKQHGIHWWPFQRSFIGLPDGGHILPLSEKKILRKTLKRKCRGMSVLSLVDRQQHVDRRWEDPVKNIGAKHICRQLVIHRVSIAKRMCRQHGIYHRWPFQQDLATMKGYSLGDERPVEVISLYTHAKLVSRLQLIYISWLSRFSPRPSALAGGGEVGGPIALSLSESAATKNIAQRVGQDQSGSASDSDNERTREQEDLEEIHASITLDDLRRLYGRMNRKDAAASLGVSESTFKRKCREYGIKRWPHVRKRKVGRPPDQHGEGNTSTARKTPPQYVQTRMGGEPVGQNHEASVFRRDFTEGPTALNTENGLIGIVKTPPFHDSCPGNYAIDYKESENAGSSFEWASQVKDQSTLSTPYPNHNALVFPQPHSMLSENRGGSIDWRNSFASQAEPFSDRHISGSSNLAFPTWSDQAAPSQHVEGQSMQSTVYPDHNAVHRFPEGHVCESINWNEHTNSLASQAEPFSDRHISGSIWRPPDQLKGQTTQFIAHQNPNALVFPQFQIASTQVLSENEDRRNSLASQVEAFFMGHVSESSNLAFPAYSDAAAPSQPLATILQTMPMTTHMIPQTGGFSGIFQLEGQLTQSTSHPNPNVVVPQVPQIASTQKLSENMASLENWEEFLSLEEETSLGGHVSGSVNLTGTTCCDPSPSQQPVTNRDMMPTTHVMSHLVAREDERSVTVKISYRDRTIKLFQVPLTSRIIELKEEVKKRLKLEPSNFDFEYKDEDDGDWIFLGCDEDLMNHLQLFSNRVIRLLVVDSDASTKNICESCGSLKRKRQ